MIKDDILRTDMNLQYMNQWNESKTPTERHQRHKICVRNLEFCKRALWKRFKPPQLFGGLDKIAWSRHFRVS